GPEWNGSQYGYDTWENHGPQRTTGTDVYAAGIVRINTVRGVFRHDFGLLTELAAHLFDHALGRGTNGADSQGTEEEDQRETDQCRDEDQNICQVDVIDDAGQCSLGGCRASVSIRNLLAFETIQHIEI